MFGRTSQRERDAMLERLIGMRGEHFRDRRATRIIDDYILYATGGKDRKKIGMEWADKCEARIAASQALLESLSRD